MFAYAKMEIAPAVGAGFKVAFFRQPRLGRRREVCRTAQHPRHARRQGIQNFGAGIAARDAFRIGRELLNGRFPAFR